MLSRRLAAVALGLSTSFVAAVALAQAAAMASGDRALSPPADPAAQAVHVLGTMHEVDELQMRLGAMAEARGTTPEIRRFGKLLYRDHRAADDDVRRLSKHYGFSYAPPAPRDRVEEDRGIEARLRSANGHEFDERFLDATRGVASGTAAYLRDAEPHMSQKDLRALTDRFVPLLDQHVAIADRLRKKP